RIDLSCANDDPCKSLCHLHRSLLKHHGAILNKLDYRSRAEVLAVDRKAQAGVIMLDRLDQSIGDAWPYNVQSMIDRDYAVRCVAVDHLELQRIRFHKQRAGFSGKRHDHMLIVSKTNLRSRDLQSLSPILDVHAG